jgi:hypothetical protein
MENYGPKQTKQAILLIITLRNLNDFMWKEKHAYSVAKLQNVWCQM